MSIQQAAQAAVQVFPNASISTSRGMLPLRVVMVAIAGAESSWQPSDLGDYGYDAQHGLCNGYSSWGLWQIHNVWSPYLIQQVGSSNPCRWAQWLFNPLNNAKAAYHVYQLQGLNAWTTYQTGAWLQYLASAQQAVQQIEGSHTTRPSTPKSTPVSPTTVPRPVTALTWLPLLLTAVGGLALAFDEILIRSSGSVHRHGPRRL